MRIAASAFFHGGMIVKKLCLLAALLLLLTACTAPHHRLPSAAAPATIAPVTSNVPLTPEATVTPTPALSPSPTPIPTMLRTVVPAPELMPENLLEKWEVFQGGEQVDYRRDVPLDFGAGADYAQVEGVVTFRGNNYRDGGAYGTVDLTEPKLTVVWKNRIGAITNTRSGSWGGVGWNGQPVIVRWDEQTRNLMNLYDEKKAQQGLTEVIYGTLDGNIYFLDLTDGSYTRDPIDFGYPIKGSVSIYPDGTPLLFMGQGINDRDGHSASRSGWRIYSLLDQSELFFLDGKDELEYRRHRLFDVACVVDAAHDTVIECGENGLVYSMELNTQYDPAAGTLSIDPQVTTYRYKADIEEYGIENAPTAYRNYLWFCDNSGLMTCLDTTTMTPLWVRDCMDDSDASTVLEEDGEHLYLYAATQIDKQGTSGICYLRKLDALTGDIVWEVQVPGGSAERDAGAYATPALGRGDLESMIYFSLCRTEEYGRGILLGVDKATGEVIWDVKLGRASWSSPTCVYDENGHGVVLHADGLGVLRMLDGRTGEVLAEVDLGANVEGSPAVFNDMLVVGTRGREIYGVKIG